MSPRRTALVLVTGVLLAACGVEIDVVSVSAERTTVPETTVEEPTTTAPTTEATPATTTSSAPERPASDEPPLAVSIPLSDVVDIDEHKPTQPHDAFVAVALTDIERWWSEVYPELYGEPFVSLEGGVYAGYPERQSPLPGCGQRRTEYADLVSFVAFYCQFGDFVIYDDGDFDDGAGLRSILTPLAEEFGSAVMGIVLAHEYGHAIQARFGALDVGLPTILTEQQADCFAGAWAGQAYQGDSPLLRLDDLDVRAGLIAMLSVRDPVGLDQFVPGGHGSAFDRVGAFQEGFVNGPGRCAPLLDEPLTLMPNEFQQQSDFLREGNASYDCTDDIDPANCTPAPEFLARDINHFWQTALGPEFEEVSVEVTDDLATVSCAQRVQLALELVVCPVERTVVYDEPAVLELYREFGDFTLGYFYGIAWAELVQRDIDSPFGGEARALLNDCLTGAWVRDITPDELGRTPRAGDRDGDGVPDTVTSSPGDLDEAIRMAILVGDASASDDIVGSPFEKIESFRAGVLGGLDACAAQL